MSESQVKVLVTSQATYIGKIVAGSLDQGQITMEDPYYVIPHETQFALQDALVYVGADLTEKSVTFNTSQLVYQNLFEPIDALKSGYLESTGGIITPPKQSIFIPD